MPEPETHAQVMHKKVQETAKSISEVIQELLEDSRQKGELPLPL